MNQELRKYVKKELKNRVNPRALRYNLIRAGWPEEDVDDAIRAGSQSSSKGILVLGMILGVVTISVALLLISTMNPDPPPQRPPGNGLTPPPQNNVSEPGTCDAIRDSIEKDMCYKELAAEGFDCRNLEDATERRFCFRALQSYLLNAA